LTFADSLQRYSENIAIITESGQEISYAGLDERIDDFAESVASTSTNQGSEFSSKQLIFLSAGNNLASIIAYLYCLKKRHAVMLINPDLFEDKSQAWLDQLMQCYRPNALIKTDCSEPAYHSLSSDPLTLHDDLALLLSTSGSTGSPKQVRLSYTNIQSNADSITLFLGLSQTERAITTLPLHYSYGLSVLNSHLSVGASIVLNEHSIVTRDFWNLFKEQAVTSFSGVPFMYETLRKIRFEGMDLPSLRYMTQAGGKLHSDAVRYFSDLLASKGQRFYVMYGQTEATARMAYLPLKDLSKHPDSIGIAISGGTFIIENGDGEIISEPDKVGELIYQGPNVMLGYALTRVDLKKGSEPSVLRTGDMAYKDKQGLFYITGRQSRIIKLFGTRVDLDDVEKRLAEQGWQTFCIGSDNKLGVACIDESHLGLITQFLRDYFQFHHTVIFVEYISALPRTSNGKICYLDLKNKMASFG